MASDLSERLRQLRDRERWTVTEMAYLTGLPKRTIDKYMLRDGASLPGFEALTALSTGLGVSLDWLVFGEEVAAETTGLIAHRASTEVAANVFEGLHRIAQSGQKSPVEGDRFYGLYPEQWAAEVGHRVLARARELAASGESRDALRHWLGRSDERLNEVFTEWFEIETKRVEERSK